jgi:hypothetical protein
VGKLAFGVRGLPANPRGLPSFGLLAGAIFTQDLQPLRSPMTRASPVLLSLLVTSLAAIPQDLPYLKANADAPAAARHRAYATTFSSAENPLSERGAWLGGKTAGLDWADVAASPGLAYGLESGAGGYDDSTALLAGAWGPNQAAEATVHAVNPNAGVSEEVELRLRSSLGPHRATGYEINFRCLKTREAYTEIVRWDGPLGNFTYLSHRDGAACGVTDGDVVRATIVGDVIRVFLNGALVNEATDSTFASGSPGLGFFLRSATGLNRDYGFSRFSATDAP